MRIARPDPFQEPRVWLLLMVLTSLPAQADPAEQICEYRALEVDAESRDIRFIPPQKIGPEDCTDTGAAIGGLVPAWRELLPPRVRWQQRADAQFICQSQQSELGERMDMVSPVGCVFLLAGEVCSIVTAQAVSHAQLANAVRRCAP